MEKLFEQWKEIDKVRSTVNPLKKEEIMGAIYQESAGTMQELKKRLKYKIMWIVGIGAAVLLFMIFNLNNAGVLLGSALILSYYIFGYFSLSKFQPNHGYKHIRYDSLRSNETQLSFYN